jgi:hypothetical protein
MKKSLSIRAYLGLSHALLLVICLGVIGFIWSVNEYQVITRELEELTRQRVTLLADIVGHEIEEEDELTLSRAELSVVDQEEDLPAVFFDNSGEMYELMPGTVSPYQTDLFRRLEGKYHFDEGDYTTLVHTESESTSIYAAARVLDNQNQVIGTVCMLMPIGSDPDRRCIRCGGQSPAGSVFCQTIYARAEIGCFGRQGKL